MLVVMGSGTVGGLMHFECHSALSNLSRAATLRKLQQARSVV